MTATSERLAKPEDFALWGAQLGIVAARGLRLLPEGGRRRQRGREYHRVMEDSAAVHRRGGASEDEIELFRTGYERAAELALAHPTGVGVIRIVILAKGGRELVFEETL